MRERWICPECGMTFTKRPFVESELTALRAENTRLTALVKDYEQNGRVTKRFGELRAENEALRGALESIANGKAISNTARVLQNRARVALEQEMEVCE